MIDKFSAKKAFISLTARRLESYGHDHYDALVTAQTRWADFVATGLAEEPPVKTCRNCDKAFEIGASRRTSSTFCGPVCRYTYHNRKKQAANA